jgi:putative oxidoreductase
MDHRDDTPKVSTQRVPRAVLWTVQVLLAVAFLYFSYNKLTGAPQTIDSFEAIGLGQWLRYLTGSLELAGAIGLVIPRLAGLAALGLFGVMIGAVATEVFVMPDGNPGTPLVLLLVTATLAWLHRDRTRALLFGSPSGVGGPATSR